MNEKKADNKYSFLLKVSFTILVVSAALLFISTYSFFKKPKEEKAATTATEVKAIRDSLEAVYAATLKKLDDNFAASWNSADTLSAGLDIKIAEFNKLRSEITTLLKDQSSAGGLAAAQVKIMELQQKVNALRSKNTDVEEENRRLQLLLQQLSANGKTSEQPAAIKPAVETKAVAAAPNGPLLTSKLQLIAINNTEKKTNAADDAEKFVGSFVVRNAADKRNTDLMVILLQPDGKVVRNSAWESGTFDSDEGKKIYSRKLRFDPGENEKQLNFSINPDRFFKGEYTMQIWYNGNLVGMLKKALS